MMNNTTYKIFKKGSRTYFYSSIFFPQNIKEDVFTLYSFVRTADDLVDCIPQKKKEFLKFKQMTLEGLNGKSVKNPIIKRFLPIVQKYKFDKEWVRAFLKAMESDLKKSEYKSISELEKYIYGSAEVVGLMMAKIFALPKKSYPYARLMGKSMQYINFIRDIREDSHLGRIYMPTRDLKKFGLKSLDYDYIQNHKEQFKVCIRFHIRRYQFWLQKAKTGLRFIPFSLRIPVITASKMYEWTSQEIEKNPFIIYRTKVKPTILHIIITIIITYISEWLDLAKFLKNQNQK